MLRPPRFMARQLAHPSGLLGRYVMSPFLNRLNRAHNSMVLQDLALQPTSRVLEVGFGGADLLESLCRRASDGHIAGLELSQAMLASARIRLRRWAEAGRLELSLGSIESLPYPDQTFDRACTVHTIYFWPDLGQGLRELHRVMCPGGRLVLGFLSADDIGRAGLDRHGFARYSLDALESALVAARFSPGPLRSAHDLRGTLYSLLAERF
jgi:ubiquinone/menaquinone biosynthesis C-methylase UbiE